MAKIGGHASISATMTLTISEEEAAALDAITGYGADEFLKWFYKVLGESYLKPHEKGLRELFQTTRVPIQSFLKRVEEARAAFSRDERGSR